MKYYFGAVPQRDIEEFGVNGLFYNNDQYYYYCVEFGSNPGGFEDVTITDTVGRTVPVSTEHLCELSAVLNECETIEAEIKHAKSLIEDMESYESTATVEGTNINYN